MTSQLGNERDLLYQKLLLLNVYEQNHRVNGVRVDDWTAKLAIIASNVFLVNVVDRSKNKSSRFNTGPFTLLELQKILTFGIKSANSYPIMINW